MKIVTRKLLLGLAMMVAGTSAAEEAAEKPSDPRQIDKRFKLTNGYVHSWVAFPKVSGKSLGDGGTLSVPSSPTEGRAAVVFFLASSCIPCQDIIHGFKDIEEKYEELNVDFLYVFTHDTKRDAIGFSKAYGIADRSIIASPATLEAFLEPQIPSIFLADRTGWMSHASIVATRDSLHDVDEILRYATGL